MPWPEAVSAYSSKCWATAERVIVIAADTRRTDTPRRLGRAQGGLYQLAPSLPLPVASVRLTVALTVALHRLPAPLQPLRGGVAVLHSQHNPYPRFAPHHPLRRRYAYLPPPNAGSLQCCCRLWRPNRCGVAHRCNLPLQHFRRPRRGVPLSPPVRLQHCNGPILRGGFRVSGESRGPRAAVHRAPALQPCPSTLRG